MTINHGTLTLRTANSKPEATFIVTGIGRSGTSMVSKVLAELGVPMGANDAVETYEDRDFIQTLLYHDFGGTDVVIQKRNRQYSRWGFKFPSLQNHLMAPQLLRFRNPHLIVVMRDPVAIAERAMKSDKALPTAEAAFANVTEQMADMSAFIRRAQVPTLLLSYEKAIAFPSETVTTLARFCDIYPQDAAAMLAIQAIAPNNEAYRRLFA